MGRIAQEILKSFEVSRNCDVVDFDRHLDAKNRSEAYQSHLSDMEMMLRRGFDPLHAAYISAQNLVSLLCEELSMLLPLKPFVQSVVAAEDTYVPDGPPFSPLTRSYFTSWAFFDLEFGEDRETMAGCIQALGHDLEIDPDLLHAIRLMQDSYMGVYEHCGMEASMVLLRDVVDNIRYSCYVPTGYHGEKGQLWYIRLLPPQLGYSYSIISTTPYILKSAKEEWLSFFNRTVPKLKVPFRPRPLADAIHDLLKYGLDVNYWHEYILSAYVGTQDDAIFLSGIPDIAETLPNMK